MANSTTPDRPEKPSADFPLFPHRNGRWAKKVRGKLHYFGKWSDDPKGQKALGRWLADKDDLLAGRTPRTKREGLTVADLVNRFLTFKQGQVDSGELTRRSWEDYYRVGERMVAVFGRNRLVVDLVADDFSALRQAFAAKHRAIVLARHIVHTRTVFKWGYEAGLLDRPVRYGPGFKRPPARKLRAERHQRGPRLFQPAEIRKLVNQASPPLKAMILLGINCGLGNADIGSLEHRHLDLEAGWLDFPRPKTGVERRCPLWPETVAAVKAWLAVRPKPVNGGWQELVFITAKGNAWRDRAAVKKDPLIEGNAKTVPLMGDRPVSKEFGKLLKASGLHKPGRGFYALRHTFQTIGDETKDFVAVRKIMAHTFGGDISDFYREQVSDARLRAVVDHVRGWLFGLVDMRALGAGRTAYHE